MAVIDKIYGNEKQYFELVDWIEENQPSYKKYLYYYNEEELLEYKYKENRCLSIFPEYADKWLLENCPLKWVTKYIKNQYDMEG